jgi:hypothetical protein
VSEGTAPRENRHQSREHRLYGRIYLNHQLIYEHFVAGTDGVGVDYSLTETLNSGDILDFVVAPNGPEYDDSTLFSSYVVATVSSVSSGSTPCRFP